MAQYFRGAGRGSKALSSFLAYGESRFSFFCFSFLYGKARCCTLIALSGDKPTGQRKETCEC